jgi:hypothetical protein
MQAHEERHAQLLFQIPNPLAHRGSDEVLPLGRLGNASLLDDRDEEAQRDQVETRGIVSLKKPKLHPRACFLCSQAHIHSRRVPWKRGMKKGLDDSKPLKFWRARQDLNPRPPGS